MWHHIADIAVPSFPEPQTFNGSDNRPMASVGENEDIIERDFHDLETAAREFIKTYGAAAMLRCVSFALEGK
jgi:hypothetical protein